MVRFFLVAHAPLLKVVRNHYQESKCPVQGGVGMLPAYWFYWKRKPENKMGRVGTTVVLTFAVWVGFVGGHFVNNVRGLL